MDDKERESSDPVRTCAGCRQRDARDALLRFAVQDGRVVPDPRRRLPGRGVSVHPTRACLRRAIERGGFARAAGGGVTLDLDHVCALLVSLGARRVDGLLLAARRSGALAVGTEAVRRAVDEGRARLLIVASDAAGRRDELTARGPYVVHGEKEHLGRLLGRAEVGIVAVLEQGIADEVAATAARATRLSEAE